MVEAANYAASDWVSAAKECLKALLDGKLVTQTHSRGLKSASYHVSHSPYFHSRNKLGRNAKNARARLAY